MGTAFKVLFVIYFWFAHHPKKLKLGSLPKITVSIEDQVPPLWLIYLGEKGRCEGKNFGQRIWESEVLLGTPFGNTLGTWGTGWEHDENTRIQKSTPHPAKEERWTLLGVCLIVSLAACIFYSWTWLPLFFGPNTHSTNHTISIEVSAWYQ